MTQRRFVLPSAALRSIHVWSEDFVEDRTRDGTALRIFSIIDKFTPEALSIRMTQKIESFYVIEASVLRELNSVGDVWKPDVKLDRSAATRRRSRTRPVAHRPPEVGALR